MTPALEVQNVTAQNMIAISLMDGKADNSDVLGKENAWGDIWEEEE